MIRMSPEEFHARQQQIQEQMRARLGLAASIKPGEAASKVRRASGKGRNKYGAEATMVDGMRFDSKAEAKRYLQLLVLQRVGEIANLETQVAFDLIPAQDINGRKEKPVRYFADFRYTRTATGETVVEDVKSAPTKTKEFIIKRKLVLWLHKVVIQEVLMP